MFFFVLVALTFTLSSLLPAPVDVLQALRLSQDMQGVSTGDGFCKSRGGQQPDLAYRIDDQVQLSAPTKQLFPGTGFSSYCGVEEVLEFLKIENNNKRLVKCFSQ